MYRLDGVEPEVKSYFGPVARLLLSQRDPQEALEVRAASLFIQFGIFATAFVSLFATQVQLLLDRPIRLRFTMCCAPASPSHLQAALAALSGIQEIPEPRSLLTMEEGVQVGTDCLAVQPSVRLVGWLGCAVQTWIRCIACRQQRFHPAKQKTC